MEKVNKKGIENRQMSQDLMKRFIETYKAHSNLWKVDSNNYRNKALKEKSYAELIRLIAPEIPNADKKFIAKKINTIRVCFRKEYRKWLEDKNYKPMLWYYNLLSFIVDEESDIKNDFEDEDSICFKSNFKIGKWENSSREFAVNTNVPFENENVGLEDAMCFENSNDNYETVISSPYSTERKSIHKNVNFVNEESCKRKWKENEENLDSEIEYRFSPVNFQKITELNFDEFDTFGHFISKKLKTIASENQDQYIFCENVINQAIMKAQLGKLTENSYILC